MALEIMLHFVNRSSDIDNSQVVLFAAQPVTPPRHTLRFHNKSGSTQTFVCYQVPKRTNGFALAWFAMTIASGAEVNFVWQELFDLVWMETGLLTPGVQFSASQVAPALATKNSIELTYADGAFSFNGEGPAAAPNQLIISTDGKIPQDTVSVGIGMAGSPTEVVQAMPNTNFEFAPFAEYWVTTADVTQGDVMDLSKIGPKMQVVFPPNVVAMTATLDAKQNWIIQQGLIV